MVAAIATFSIGAFAPIANAGECPIIGGSACDNLERDIDRILNRDIPRVIEAVGDAVQDAGQTLNCLLNPSQCG